MQAGQTHGSEFVVACGDLPTMFDFIEEPFDQVAHTVAVRAEGDRLVAIAP
jgi:hypothetical protein